MKDKLSATQKERKKERSDHVTAPAAPEPWACSLPILHFGQKLPNFSGRQEVHHRLVALFYEKQLSDLQMSAPASVPACRLSHSLPQFFLMIPPPPAVAVELIPHLGHFPSKPPAQGVISVAELFQVYSTEPVARLHLEESSDQRLHTCHRDRCLGPCLALESVAEVFPAPVSLPLRHGC